MIKGMIGDLSSVLVGVCWRVEMRGRVATGPEEDDK